MNRSGYYEDFCGDAEEQWRMIRWQGAVKSAIRGRRGQRLLRDLIAALDAMPEKVLIADELQDADGDVCALGAVGLHRGVKMDDIDPEDYEQVAKAFDVAEALAREIEYENDDPLGYRHGETPQQRWLRMRSWAVRHLVEPTEER